MFSQSQVSCGFPNESRKFSAKEKIDQIKIRHLYRNASVLISTMQHPSVKYKHFLNLNSIDRWMMDWFYSPPPQAGLV
jgi:hypothetical protein